MPSQDRKGARLAVAGHTRAGIGEVLSCKNCLLASVHREKHRVCSALRAPSRCVTLSPSGAQAGDMPWSTALGTAAYFGKAEEVQKLIEARASIDEKDSVSEGALQRGCV